MNKEQIRDYLMINKWFMRNSESRSINYKKVLNISYMKKRLGNDMLIKQYVIIRYL